MTWGHPSGPGVYTITTPRTPDVWPNFLYNRSTSRLVSQTGQGADGSKRLFYLKEGETGEVWNPNYVPLCRMPDRYECDHGLGHTEIRSSFHGLESTLTTVIPREGYRELWRWTLRNASAQRRALSLYALASLPNERPMGSEGFRDEASGALVSRSFPYHIRYDDAAKHLGKVPHWYWACSRQASSWTTSERRFFGTGETLGWAEVPSGVLAPALDNTGSAWHACTGVLAHEVVLEPGETVILVYQTGKEPSLEAVRTQATALSPQLFEQEQTAVEAYWRSIEETLSIETSDPDIDRFINSWLKKQMVWQTVCRRNAGAWPLRNVLQDAMGYAFIDPPGALDQAREMLALQRTDGTVQQWHMARPDLPPHLFTTLHHNDGPVWLVLCVLVIVRQTGSEAFLDEPVAFLDGGPAPVRDHLVLALEALAGDRGARGLCRLHDGDWTDPINGPGRGGKGESVWLTQALLTAVKLMPGYNNAPLVQELDEAVNRAWDGNWYAYGYDDEGKAFGVSSDPEGSVYLNAQTWGLISGAARGDRRAKTLQAVQGLDSPCGPRICWPPYRSWNPTVGRLSVKLAGTSENAAVYCHGVVFWAYAAALLGDPDGALDALRKILPTNPLNPPERSAQVPTFVPNSYFGLDDSPLFGESTLNHETGTASWFYLVFVEEILGIRATTEGLQIRPRLPAGWDGFRATRRWNGGEYQIQVSGYRADRDPVVLWDGRELVGTLLPRLTGGSADVRLLYRP